MTISNIFVYPIKSMRGSAVDEALVCAYGLEHDRRWMLVDADSKMITQRECPRLATLHPQVEAGRLRIALPGGADLVVPFNGNAWIGHQVTVDVWGHGYVGVAASDAINAALSDAIGVACRLTSIRSDIFRTTHEVAFHDDSPLLVISQASLDELNRRSPAPVPMNRFRPNVVVIDAQPFEEDLWQRITIGDDTVLRSVKACERCVIPTVDQAEGVFRGPEPLKTLATFRRKGENVAFGQYFRPESRGTKLHRGDEVKVLELKPEAAAHLSS
jgi:MOSC domain-containing protein